MADKTLTVEQVLAMLEGAPPQIAAFTAGLEPVQLHTAPQPGEWSANDVLAHLRACADVWGGYIAAMLAQDRPALITTNPRTWITKTDYPQQPFRASLRAFTAQRIDLVAGLADLHPDSWSRTAIMKGAGKPIERSVFSYARNMAVHERSHLKQIGRLAAATKNSLTP